MAQQRIAEIEDQLGDIRKELASITKGMGQLSNEAVDAGKGIKGMEKATKSVANGFKGIGLAIKAAGIGLLIQAFQVLKDLFMQNENVAAGFAAGMQFLTSIFNDLVTFISEDVVPVFTKIFNDPQQAIKDFGNLIKDNIIERFNSFLEVIESVGYGLGRLFSGDFTGFVDSMKNAGSEMVDVLTGVDDTLNKVGEVAGKVGDAVSKSFDKATKEAKKAFDLSKLTADIEIARAQMEKLRFTYMRDAELQRQMRDDNTKTIQERIKANDELARILTEQAQKEQEFLQLELNAAKTRASLNKQDRSLRAEVIRLETEMLDIQERITGQMSEQLMNRNALNQEQAQMDKTLIDSQNEVLRITLEGEASREQSILKRIELERSAAEQTYLAQKAALDAIKNDQALSMQERADAEAQMAVLDAQYAQDRLTREQQVAMAKADITSQLLTQAQGIAEQGGDLAKGVAVAQATWNAYTAITSALTSQPFGPWNIAQAVATGIFAFKQVANILKTDIDTSGGGGGGAMGSISAPSLPNISIAQGLNRPESQVEAVVNAPVRAYVVTKEVTSGQSLDRNTIRNATLAPG